MTTTSLHAAVGYARRIFDCETRRRTDRQLLDRFTADRDEAAFAELVRRHGPMVLAVCRRVLRHQQDAEDAFQAAFLVLARKAGGIRQSASVGGWLYQVAFRLALRARAVGLRRRSLLVTLPEAILAPGSESPMEHLSIPIEEELDRLPEHYRSAVILCYLEGRTQTEAARHLATTADAVNSRLKRARELLRQRLARHGTALSVAALTEALVAGGSHAALPAHLLRPTARAALEFAVSRGSACGASAAATSLAKGALITMGISKTTLAVAGFVSAALLSLVALFGNSSALGDDPAGAKRDDAPPRKPVAKAVAQPEGKDKAKPQYSVILLWMSGGPSQIDTFDPKPANVNGALFEAIDTSVKGLRISKTLPGLAKQADHLAIIRSLIHREGDHARSTFLMRTGFSIDDGRTIPSLACVLAKELGDGRPNLPRHFNIAPQFDGVGVGRDPGFLGPQYAALKVALTGTIDGQPFEPPTADEFDALAKGKGEAHREAVAKAFDLKEENDDTRKAYGINRFGQGCLLARRLVERGVPVVEVSMGGWDMHQNIPGILPKQCAELDAGMATLIKDLHQRKRLDTTLIIWMGEFGRTPIINAQAGRDHYPSVSSVVLAGAKIKGGQAIGKTSADGVQIEERPVKPPELVATIYQAVGVDPAKQIQSATGTKVSIVEKETKSVKEALR
jgi:RNA polymerase sigma factor (sigma-70 family)